MAKLGVMEIFFGSPWPMAERLALAEFLKEYKYDFYIYGPKADKRLRKGWREEWPADYLRELASLSEQYRAQGVRFGVALSPYGIGAELTSDDQRLLESKVRVLEKVGIDILGLFFDDMPVNPGLAESQIAALKVIRAQTRAQIVFCPTFYTYDPILDKVFGTRPEQYLEKIAAAFDESIELAWTGPKVISEEITAEHLSEVAKLLHRPPFICDNFFANDGPKNCKLLKLKLPIGRDRAALAQSRYWSQNPMNQIHLSKIVLAAFSQMALRGQEPEAAFASAVRSLCAPPVAEFVIRHRTQLLETGLDKLPLETKQEWLQILTPCRDVVAAEICDWLEGKYQVGTECLTD